MFFRDGTVLPSICADTRYLDDVIVSKANFTPAVNNDWINPGPEPVGAHPEGGSADGVQDLVRSVWQMTSVFEDDHTRSVLLRGGSNYGRSKIPLSNQESARGH